MNLNTDQLNIDRTEDGKAIVEPDYLGFLRNNGYNIDAINDIQAAPSESRDLVHLVYKIETTEYPSGHAKLDAVAHSTELIVCTCEDFRYNKGVDVSEKPLASGNVGTCKHGRACCRTERAESDNAQDTLK